MRHHVLIVVLCVLSACTSSSNGDGTAAQAETSGAAETAGGTETVGAQCAEAEGFASPACHPFCGETLGCAAAEICTLNGDKLQCAAAGEVALGATCDSTNRCAEGACVGTDADGFRCLAFCQDVADCKTDELCNVNADVAGGGTLSLCGPKPKTCSLFAQDCAVATDACYLGKDEPICLKAGSLAIGAACESSDECLKGLLCAGDLCLEICNPKTNGPDPKCHLKCPDSTTGLEGESSVAVCSIE